MDLPVVDLSAPLGQQTTSLSAACGSVGFFRIPLSSIDLDVANAAWRDAAEFFARPESEKLAVEFPYPGYPYGYSPFGYEALANSLDSGPAAQPDLKESLSVGPDCGIRGDEPATAETEWIRSPSRWPTNPSGLRESWTSYYRALADVAEHLMSVMALALDLPADYFASMIDNPITSMRALHYPALRSAPESGALRAGAHSDYGTLTILRTDDVPGLEILDRDGSWAAVDPDPNSFVVNLGDSIAQWTNDRWPSTMHRVTTVDPRPRHSLAFFHMANWDAMIECLPGCREPGISPRHEPAQAGPWLMRKFQSTVQTEPE